MRMGKCIGHLQATQGFRVFPFITEFGSISFSPPLWGWFYLSLISFKLGMILVPFWDVSHRMLWCPERFCYYGWKVSYSHPSTRSYPDAGFLSGFTNPLGAQTRWKVQGPLLGLTCAISVVTQHEHPCYSRRFIICIGLICLLYLRILLFFLRDSKKVDKGCLQPGM